MLGLPQSQAVGQWTGSCRLEESAILVSTTELLEICCFFLGQSSSSRSPRQNRVNTELYRVKVPSITALNNLKGPGPTAKYLKMRGRRSNTGWNHGLETAGSHAELLCRYKRPRLTDSGRIKPFDPRFASLGVQRITEGPKELK
jgi:hypothetical protein